MQKSCKRVVTNFQMVLHILLRKQKAKRVG